MGIHSARIIVVFCLFGFFGCDGKGADEREREGNMGDLCEDDRDCDEGYFCVDYNKNNICAQGCAFNTDCLKNEVCSGGAYYLSAGRNRIDAICLEKCAGDRDCPDELKCESVSMRGEKGKIGASCWDAATCEDGLFCARGEDRCLEPCTDDSQCDGFCLIDDFDSGPDQGKYCSTNTSEYVCERPRP